MPERGVVDRRHHHSIAETRGEPFDCIERFHDPRLQRRLDAQDEAVGFLTRPSAKTGWNPLQIIVLLKDRATQRWRDVATRGFLARVRGVTAEARP